jgi:hypothetical protein
MIVTTGVIAGPTIMPFLISNPGSKCASGVSVCLDQKKDMGRNGIRHGSVSMTGNSKPEAGDPTRAAR